MTPKGPDFIAQFTNNVANNSGSSQAQNTAKPASTATAQAAAANAQSMLANNTGSTQTENVTIASGASDLTASLQAQIDDLIENSEQTSAAQTQETLLDPHARSNKELIRDLKNKLAQAEAQIDQDIKSLSGTALLQYSPKPDAQNINLGLTMAEFVDEFYKNNDLSNLSPELRQQFQDHSEYAIGLALEGKSDKAKDSFAILMADFLDITGQHKDNSHQDNKTVARAHLEVMGYEARQKTELSHALKIYQANNDDGISSNLNTRTRSIGGELTKLERMGNPFIENDLSHSQFVNDDVFRNIFGAIADFASGGFILPLENALGKLEDRINN